MGYFYEEIFENMLRLMAVWCVLVFRLYLEKLIYFYIKNNYYRYSFPMRLVIALGNFLGKPVIIDAF